MIWDLLVLHPHDWLQRKEEEMKSEEKKKSEGEEKNRRVDCYQSEGMRRRN